MNEDDLQSKLQRAEATAKELREELTETNRGLLALMQEIHKKDEETRNAYQQLWHASKLATIGELAASVAHELNNPLATIGLRVESLLESPRISTSEHHALQVIEAEIDRMSRLVGNLLQFSRRGELQVSSIDVREELDATLELVQYRMRNLGITVERDYSPHLPLLPADRQQLRQVFLNLMTNACDAMPVGGTLRLVARLASLDVALVVIEDSGTGIAPEHLAQVMEPFFTTKPPEKGTGLGLPVCQRIVKSHGGEISITSTVGKGTSVSITLPVRGYHDAKKELQRDHG